MRVITVGESMGLIRGNGIGTFAHLGSAEIDTGGAEGNVAIGLARLGVPVTWVGRVGDDSIGRRVLRDLRGENVTVEAIIDYNASTGLMIKESPRPGHTSVTYYRSGSAGSRITPTDLENIDIEHADLLHITGITPALSQSACDTIWSVLDRARDGGVQISFDVNHRSRLWPAETAATVYKAITARTDIVFAGADEAEILVGRTGLTVNDLAREIAALGPAEVVIKNGAKGATTYIGGEAIHQTAYPVEVVDTVGAGDAFVAGYLAERLAAQPVTTRLTTGAECGSFACTHPGDWQGFAHRVDLKRIHHDPVSR